MATFGFLAFVAALLALGWLLSSLLRDADRNDGGHGSDNSDLWTYG